MAGLTKSMLILLITGILLPGCSALSQTSDRSPSSSSSRGPGPQDQITLLHTNDIHAAYLAEPATWQDDRAAIGGFAVLDARVRQIRASRPHVLLLDAGDVMTGNPITRLESGGVAGFALFGMMNEVGYDAWTPGNHDFDLGQESLYRILPRLKFPTISSNIHRVDRSAPDPALVRSTVLRSGPWSVGVMGVVTPDLPKLLPQAAIEGLEVEDPAAAVGREALKLERSTDFLVVLSHMGETRDRALAEAVPEIDVILGGHSHQRLYPPVQVGHTLIVQAGSHLQHLGRLDLQVKDRKISHFSAELIPLWEKDAPPPAPPMAALIADARKRLDTEYAVQIGTLAVPWSRQYHAESNVGNWITDQMRESQQADLAFLNSGGIRKDLPAGPLTRGQLTSVLPFDNVLCTFQVQGRYLPAVVQSNIDAVVTRSRGILQVSGLEYRWRRAGSSAEILTLTVGGRPVDPDRVYTGVTNDFLLFSQPEKYFGDAVLLEPTHLPMQLFDTLESAIRKYGTVDARLDGRIQEAPTAGSSPG